MKSALDIDDREAAKYHSHAGKDAVYDSRGSVWHPFGAGDSVPDSKALLSPGVLSGQTASFGKRMAYAPPAHGPRIESEVLDGTGQGVSRLKVHAYFRYADITRA